MLRAQREFLVQTNPPQTISALRNRPSKLSMFPLSEAVRVQTPSSSSSSSCLQVKPPESVSWTGRCSLIGRITWVTYCSSSRAYTVRHKQNSCLTLQVKGRFNHCNVDPARRVYEDMFSPHATDNKHVKNCHKNTILILFSAFFFSPYMMPQKNVILHIINI